MSLANFIEPLRGYFEKAISWLKKSAPYLAAMAIYRHLKRKIWIAERTIDAKDLEISHHENKEKVQKENAGKSDSDIIRDAISEGGELRGGSKPSQNN